MSAALELIKKASRPFKSFTVTFGEGDNETVLNLKVRRESAAQSLELAHAFNDAFAEAEKQITSEDGADLSSLRRSFARYTKERLAEFIVQADRIEYLSQASSELDDLPFQDKRVQKRAEELGEEQKLLLVKAPDDEVLEQAIERRAYILATLRAQRAQNEKRVLLTIFNSDETEFAKTVEELREALTGDDINRLVEESNKALAGDTSKDNPLKPAPKKPSRERTTSQNSSEEE